MMKFVAACAVGALLAAGPALGADGKAIYEGVCVGCHGTGAGGSPLLGNKEVWAPRIARGLDALFESAKAGVPGTAMLPRGSCVDCSDDQLKAAIDYMVSQSQ